MIKTPKTFPVERKAEQLLDDTRKGILSVVKYITRKPKNRFEVMDKHALIFEVLAIISLFVAIYIRSRG